MLFNSYLFLFIFFPIVLILYLFLYRLGQHYQNYFLLLASLFFYGWWDSRFLLLLLSSFSINYAAGCIVDRYVHDGKQRAANQCMKVTIIINIIILMVFKYAYFTITNINIALGTNFTIGGIILPLGISFFTFEQISFLVDIRRGQTRPSLFVHYALFVSFFPRLVAGPILRYSEIAPQLTRTNSFGTASDNLAGGLTMFFIGLAKKTLLADGIAPYASSAFAAANRGEPVDLLIAWGGALAYACQLYFDFSGYSDMAIGAARCFGVRFPMNFNSPYKATSIIEFWRCWHMTLSRFLRDYLYIALGGNRRGRARRFVNLFVTMLLGGLWHGANWTFIVWGGLHGVYLIANHAWLAVAERSTTLTFFRHSRTGSACGLVMTFFAVVVAWVFFRAPSFHTAFNLLSGMFGAHGIIVPSGLEFAFGPMKGILMKIGVRFAEGSGSMLVMTYLWVSALLGIVFLFPNSQQIMARIEPVLEASGNFIQTNTIDAVKEEAAAWQWKPSPVWAMGIGAITFLSVIAITRISEFLYWQF